MAGIVEAGASMTTETYVFEWSQTKDIRKESMEITTGERKANRLRFALSSSFLESALR